MSTVTNPLSGLIDGLLQGHQLASQLHHQKQQDEAFKTQQILDNQRISSEQIMQEMRNVDNQAKLSSDYRPVSDLGTVQDRMNLTIPGAAGNPGTPAGQPPDIYNLPQQGGPSTPSPDFNYDRKADPSRTTTYQGRKYERKTPEELHARDLQRQIGDQSELEKAKVKAQNEAAASTRKNQLTLEGGGTPSKGLDSVGVADGTPLTRAETIALTEAAQKIRSGNQIKLSPGETVQEMPGVGAAGGGTPGAAPRVIAEGGPPEVNGEFGAYLRAAALKAGYTVKNAPPDLVMKATTDYANKAGGTTETVNQWIADSQSKDPAVAAPAKAKLAQAVEQAKAGRPVINMTVPGLGPGSESQKNPQAIGEDFMKTLPPGTAAQVRAIANGSTTMPSFGSRGASAALRDAVYRFDPSYTEQRAQVRKAFTTGKDGTNIGALNTATVHLDQMAEAAKAMKNGTFTPGNEIYNYIATKFGASAPTNYAFVMNSLAGEAATALKGAATDPEIAHIMSTLKPGMSPEQAAGVANTGLHVFGAKLNTYQERYAQQIPNDKVYSPVLPSAKAVFDKYGINATPGAQGGGAKTYAQTGVGPDGHKIGWNPGDAGWTDLTTGKPVGQ